MELKEIMAAFVEETGLAGLEPDEEGAFHLDIDDMTVSFAEEAETGRLITWAEICEPPPEGKDMLNRILLEAMFPGGGGAGAVFSLDRESGKVYLHRYDALALTDLAGFKAMLEEFVNTLEKWKTAIADFRVAAPEIRKALDESDAAARQLDRGGFMQV